MDYAKKSLGLLSPKFLSKCVSASASMTHQLLVSPPPPLRPFRVTNCDRTLRKGIMAESLEDLQEKVRGNFLLVGDVRLALDEDGTIVETEAFFRTLDDGAVFVALAEGQAWRPFKADGYWLVASHKPQRRIDVACVTFDLYKTDPRDFVGCLNVKATLYGTYSMSYDMRCYGAKRIAREALRWTLLTMQATGHVLLGTSCYVRQMLDATEQPDDADLTLGAAFHRHPPQKTLW